MSFSLLRNGQVLIGIYRLSTTDDGLDTLDNAVVTLLEVGDVLSVQAGVNSVVYADGGYQTGFFGMLLYTA